MINISVNSKPKLLVLNSTAIDPLLAIPLVINVIIKISGLMTSYVLLNIMPYTNVCTYPSVNITVTGKCNVLNCSAVVAGLNPYKVLVLSIPNVLTEKRNLLKSSMVDKLS